MDEIPYVLDSIDAGDERTPGQLLPHDGKLIATIAPADGPGVRVVTKHGIQAKPAPEGRSGVNVMEITVRAE